MNRRTVKIDPQVERAARVNFQSAMARIMPELRKNATVLHPSNETLYVPKGIAYYLKNGVLSWLKMLVGMYADYGMRKAAAYFKSVAMQLKSLIKVLETEQVGTQRNPVLYQHITVIMAALQAGGKVVEADAVNAKSLKALERRTIKLALKFVAQKASSNGRQAESGLLRGGINLRNAYQMANSKRFDPSGIDKEITNGVEQFRLLIETLARDIDRQGIGNNLLHYIRQYNGVYYGNWETKPRKEWLKRIAIIEDARRNLIKEVGRLKQSGELAQKYSARKATRLELRQQIDAVYEQIKEFTAQYNSLPPADPVQLRPGDYIVSGGIIKEVMKVTSKQLKFRERFWMHPKYENWQGEPRAIRVMTHDAFRQQGYKKISASMGARGYMLGRKYSSLQKQFREAPYDPVHPELV